MEQEIEFGSEELKKIFEDNSNYAKFEVGKGYKVLVLSNKIKPVIKEFDGKSYNKYDIEVKIDDQDPKIWSVSKKVLKIIADSIDKTKEFNVMLNDKSYSVIPIV